MSPSHLRRVLALSVLALAPIAAAWQPADATAPVASASERDAAALGVGRYVADAGGRDLSGKDATWRSGRGERLTVVALTSCTCPLSRKFAPALARIEAAYADRGVKFVHVNVSGDDDADAMRAQVKEHAFRGLYLADHELRIATTLGASTTTEVFVIDAANTLVYRGAVSDQYGIGVALDAPRHRYVEDALDAALGGRRPTVRATSAPGCVIELPETAPDAAPTITYSKDVARIVQDNCVECHRDGGVGPFPLQTYDQVARRASMIRAVTQAGIMPPWFAASAGEHGPSASMWANDRSLAESDKAILAAWVEGGKPRGDDADLPLPRAFPTGEWSIGTPDAVFQIAEPISIKAEGVMPYQVVIVPTNIEADRWVSAAQILPTNKAVVHHVLVFIVPEAAVNDPELRDRALRDEAGGFFAAYVPGNDAVVYNDGFAKSLPARSALLFQIHYTPNGVATTDQLKLGLRFAGSPPRHIIRTAEISNHKIEIPPGAANHEERAEVRAPMDAVVLAFMPHMHVRGSAFRYEIEAEGEPLPRTLLDIPRYDFNWQLRYELREPLKVDAGTLIRATAWYDNSDANPANPDSGVTVRWGPQTYDEMMIGYVEYYLVDEDPSDPRSTPAGFGTRGARQRSQFERLLRRFDADKNGSIERSESPENLLTEFDRLDRNHDGVLKSEDFAP
ncbi:MAG: redoxin family protein [Phycisphaerales bacterium]